MFWSKKIKNEVPEGYEFSRSYSITVEFKAQYADRSPWMAQCIDDSVWCVQYADTKEEAIIKAQNALYRYDRIEKVRNDNPSETFTIPPIRKFDGN